MALSACLDWTLNSETLLSEPCHFLVVYSQHVLLNSPAAGMCALRLGLRFPLLFPFWPQRHFRKHISVLTWVNIFVLVRHCDYETTRGTNTWCKIHTTVLCDCKSNLGDKLNCNVSPEEAFIRSSTILAQKDDFRFSKDASTLWNRRRGKAKSQRRGNCG